MKVIRRRTLLLGVALTQLVLNVAPGARGLEGGEAPLGAPAGASRPPYLQRGDEVEARYRVYRERLEQLFKGFSIRLEAQAPDLLARLRAAPPDSVPYGYGILPKFIPDPPRTNGARAVSVSYSWRRTEGFIDRDQARLERLEPRLAQGDKLTAENRREEWEKMVDECRTLAAYQKLIAGNIEYNRLWQGEIARNRPGYDVQTTLHDAVVQRQAVRDTLGAGDEVLEPYLRAREETLSYRIDEATRRVSPPDFLRVEHPSSHRWILRVPVFTDIGDAAFVQGFRSAVENAWHVKDGEDEFSVALEIRSLPPNELYPDGKPPARGQHIDQAQHLRRFPPGGVVLTTGPNLTYVLGRSIDVGAHDIAPNALAHEFGHMLGFPDRYFRGYRDRGADGFEVLEMVIDPDDIMATAGNGRVWRYHFEKLLDARQHR